SLACMSYNENLRRSPRRVCVFTHVYTLQCRSEPSSSQQHTDHRRDVYSTRNYVVPQVLRTHTVEKERERERETRNDGEVPVICQCPNKGMRLFPRGAAAVYKLLYTYEYLHIELMTHDSILLCDENEPFGRVDAQDESGRSWLHYFVARGLERSTEFLLLRHANPNVRDALGSSPLHVMCKRGVVTTLRGDSLMELFFRTCERLDRWVFFDVRDIEGRTELQWAVASCNPNAVGLLAAKYGRDLLRSRFVFPSADYFGEGLKPSWWLFEMGYNFKLKLVARVLDCVERLEKAGYELGRSDVLTIMRFFTKHGLFDRTAHLYDCLRNGRFYMAKNLMKKIMIQPDLSLRDLIQLSPKQAAKRLTFADYFDFANSWKLLGLGAGPSEACVMHLCEIMSRGFFRRCALYFFHEELICHRLPIEICEIIIDESIVNEDLCNICLAAEVES
ncbi:unnamed protein product, partial [Trichogramma brassicae]